MEGDENGLVPISTVEVAVTSRISIVQLVTEVRAGNLDHLPPKGLRIDPQEVIDILQNNREMQVGFHDMDNQHWGKDYRWSTTDKLLVVGTRPTVERAGPRGQEIVDLRPKVGDLLSSRFMDDQARQARMVKVGIAIFVRVEHQQDPPGGFWGWVRPIGWFMVEQETGVVRHNRLDDFSVEYKPPR